MNDRGELSEDVRVRLGRVGIMTDGELDDGESERPNVGRGGVGSWRSLRFSLNSFRLVQRVSIGAQSGEQEDVLPCTIDNRYSFSPNFDRVAPKLRNRTA